MEFDYKNRRSLATRVGKLRRRYPELGIKSRERHGNWDDWDDE